MHKQDVLVYTSLRIIFFEELIDTVHSIVQNRLEDLWLSVALFNAYWILWSGEINNHDLSFYRGQSFKQLGIHDMRQDRFVNLMASQGAYVNLFSYGG